MDAQRLDALLAGASPQLNDFVAFSALVKELPEDMLWELAAKGAQLHDSLKKVLLAHLQSTLGPAEPAGAAQPSRLETHWRRRGLPVDAWCARGACCCQPRC